MNQIDNPTFRVISLCDPHLESLSYAQLTKYGKTRDAADLPPIPPSSPPATIFHCRRFTRDQYYDFVARGTEDLESRYVRAFYAGVMKVTGGPSSLHFEPEFVRNRDLMSWTDEEIDQLELVPVQLSDVGQWIYTASVFPKGSSPRCRLLPMSVDAWAGNARLYAERTLGTAPQSNEKPREE